MKRNTRFHGRALLLVTPSHLSHLGEDDGRRDSVRLDVDRPPFGSHDARQHVQPALGGAIGGMSLASDLGSQRRDIDDLATPLPHHSRRDELREQEWSPEIDGLSLVPVFDRGLQQTLAMKDARVVHENVYCSEELDSPGTGGARAIDRPQVPLNLAAPATLAPHRLPP